MFHYLIINFHVILLESEYFCKVAWKLYPTKGKRGLWEKLQHQN